jgi:hypothetical protein
MVSVLLGRKRIIPQFNILETPVWYFIAYTLQDVLLPFMTKSNVYPEYEVVSRVTIESVPYNMVTNLEECRAKTRTWVQVGGIVYVHFDNHSPRWPFHNLFHEILRGFSDSDSYISNGLFKGVFCNAGYLKYNIRIREEADDLEYGAMKFKNDSIEFINKDGIFDDVFEYLGADLFVYINDILEYKLYVKNVKIKLGSAVFECGDIRERFQSMIPNKKFTKEDYPFIKEDFVDQDMQEVFGRCEWVPCVCINELDIYEDVDKKTIKPTRTFRAASKITALDYVMIKMTQPETTGTDGPVFTRHSVPSGDIQDDGTFTLPITKCMPLVWGDEVPELFDVYATGTFINHTTPLEIIKYILDEYESFLYSPINYNTVKITEEIGGLKAPIGLVLDKPEKIFDIIAKLQTGSSKNFQFVMSKNLFSAKLDDNERSVSHTIRINDILNINDVEIDMNNDLYATIVDIGYAVNYRTGKPKHYVNEKYRLDIKNRNNYDKTYKNDTFLYSEAEAVKKSEALISFFKNIHPSINNIKIKAVKNLQIYDVINIDLRTPIEDRGKISMFAGVVDAGFSMFDQAGGTDFVFSPAWKEEPKYRNFGGEIKGKIMSIEHDVTIGIMTIGITKL